MLPRKYNFMLGEIYFPTRRSFKTLFIIGRVTWRHVTYCEFQHTGHSLHFADTKSGTPKAMASLSFGCEHTISPFYRQIAEAQQFVHRHWVFCQFVIKCDGHILFTLFQFVFSHFSPSNKYCVAHSSLPILLPLHRSPMICQIMIIPYVRRIYFHW